MTTAVNTPSRSRDRGGIIHNTTSTSMMELSLSDLKKPFMIDGSSKTTATVEESYNQQSFDFLNRSVLVRPLGDNSETTKSRARMAALHNSGGNWLNDTSGNSRVTLSERLQNRWNNSSGFFQDSFSSMDSSAARAGGPGRTLTELEEEDDDEDDDPLKSLPLFRQKPGQNGSKDLFMGESLLDFESVCFEPDVISTTAEQKRAIQLRNQKYASGLSTLAEVGRTTTAAILQGKTKELLGEIGKSLKDSASPKPAVGNRDRSSRSRSQSPAVMRDGSETSARSTNSNNRQGRQKELLAEPKKVSAKPEGRSSRKDSASPRPLGRSKERSSRSRSHSPTALREESARSTNASTRRRRPSRRGDRISNASSATSGTSARPQRRRRNSNRRLLPRDDSPPPLVESPQEGRRLRQPEPRSSNASSRRSSEDQTAPQFRRVKSSDNPRPATQPPRGKPRRTKSNDEGHAAVVREVGRRKARRTSKTFQQVAMNIDLDDITASNHTPDYYYLDDTTAGTTLTDKRHRYQDSMRSNDSSRLLQDLVQVVKAKEVAKKRKTSVMENLLTMLLQDIGADTTSTATATTTPTHGSDSAKDHRRLNKPRRARSGRRIILETSGSASHASSSTSSGSGSGTGRTSNRRRKQSKERA